MIVACLTCAAPIEWALTLHARTWVPLDPGHAEDGNLAVVEWHRGSPVIRLVPLAHREGLELRRSHRVTCPHADRLRRPR